MSSGNANIIKKLKYQAISTVKVTIMWCLNQLPYLYKMLDVSTKESNIFEISGA